MKTFFKTSCFVAFLLSVLYGPSARAQESWTFQRIHEKFFAEGASAGDINGDGVVDLVAGPMWFAGPEFSKSHLIANPREFPITTYSDQFFSKTFDANADGHTDVLVLGFPGKSARLYLNPGESSEEAAWAMSEVASIVDNESPAIVDFVPGGLPEIVCGREGQYGFYQAGENPSDSWTWHPVTRPGACAGRFAHGLGTGDVNGDGRLDILDKTYWWEQPEDLNASGRGKQSENTWTRHQWAPGAYGQGGSQIEVYDIDGDGDQDIVTSLSAHGFGLAWFEQVDASKPFVRHDIMGSSSVNNPYGVAFSQLHALELADMDGDGLKDIVTGKRWMAHQGKDPGGLQEAVLYWFQLKRGSKGPEFLPREIHSDSGVGVDVLVQDLDGDSKLDIVSCSKRGLSVHRQNGDILAGLPDRWDFEKGKDQTTYADGLSPEDAAKKILVPEGFEVDLIASEPELTQPIAMCFDPRGRIWVIEGHTYPTKAPEGEGKDRVVIFEDADANGTFETKKTFIEGLNLASGIEVGFGGVWIGAAPELLFIPDADRDDVPDSKPQVLLDGWGYQDTHETLNSFTWGPDGWLYGCHGVFTRSNVGKPGAKDNERTRINAGVWRYHPTRHEFEVFAHGTSNPWGVDFNDQGEWFLSACVIPHMYHIQQGARYQRQAGSHFNPYTFEDIKTIADHAHYSGTIQEHAYWGDNKVSKPPAPMGTSMLGGGHAHCGLAIYNGGVFPSKYENKLFFHNLHGHRLLQESVRRQGSGFVAMHQPDFALAQDHLEIGVGVMVGPDGALYTSDWHDVQTCHNRKTEVWDRTNGRIFRIRYGGVRSEEFNLWESDDTALVSHLVSDNGYFARQAQRLLQERAAAGELADSTSASIFAILNDASAGQRNRLRALWTLGCIGVLDEPELQRLLKDDDEYVRAWAIHFIAESHFEYDFTIGVNSNGRSVERLSFGEYAFEDESRVTRRFMASVLQRLPYEIRWPIIENLASRSLDVNDPNLPLLVWYGLDPLVKQDPERAYATAKASRWSKLLQFTIRRAANSAPGRDMLVAKLMDKGEASRRIPILEELSRVAESRAGLEMPAQWPAAYSVLAKANARTSALARSLAVQFGDASVLPFFRTIFADASKSVAERMTALEVMRDSNDEQLPEMVFALLAEKPNAGRPSALSAPAISALARYNHPEAAKQLLSAFDAMDSDSKTAALSVLVARKESARMLADAIDDGSLDAKQIPAFIIRQAISLGDRDLNARLEKSWGRIAPSKAETKALYEKYRAMLKPKALQAANASRGRVLYEQNCGQCHKMFGVGGEIGPEITGANRSDLEYWLENVLEPNALIGKAYQVTKFLTADGQVINGIVQSENEDAVTVQTATERVVLDKEDIEFRELSETSLMPQGQLEPMSRQQVLELFHYLMSPNQVPPDYTMLRKPGTIILEGERLDAKSSAGNHRTQGMGGFGNSWSGDSQLWWTGAKPGASIELMLRAESGEDAVKGDYAVEVYLTKAVDYAQVRVQVLDRKGNALLDPIDADLFDRTVMLAEPISWESVKFAGGERLKVEITGANSAAVKSYMVGIDRIELVPKNVTSPK